MSKFNDVVNLFDEMTQIGLNAIKEFDDFYRKEKLSLLDVVAEDIERYKRTGVLTFNGGSQASNNVETSESTQPQQRGRPKQRTNPSGRSSSLKENANPEPPCTTALYMGNDDNMANVLVENVVVKLERLKEDFINKQGPEIANLPIKREITEMLPPSKPPIRQTRKRKGTRNTNASSNSDVEAVQIKEELIDQESKKKRAVTKSTSSGKPPSASRDSDVQINSEPIDTINLVDTDEEETEKSTRSRARTKTKSKNRKETNSSADKYESGAKIPETTRVTRTKARNIAKNKEAESDQESAVENQKRMHKSSSTEDEEKDKKTVKRTKTKKMAANKKNDDDDNGSVYEDAVSEIENSKKTPIGTKNPKANQDNQMVTENDKAIPTPPQALSETMVLNKPTLSATIIENPKKPILMNETIVLSKLPTSNQELFDDLMTDDEDIIVSPVRAQKAKKQKQVFSPYANSPVKKRVEAFEKLGAEANSELPPRMTRTKTKAKAQEEVKENGTNNETETVPENIPSSTKRGAIPKLQNRILHHAATPDESKLRGYHRNMSGCNNISLAAKSKSALKASQTEFRERELKRKQKEAEALSKKEAILQEQNEARRRKREERQLKAQQMREALEKDKQKMLESAERQKQEKMKQMMAEKEEKLLKLREEAARKRAHALKKAAEEKQKEEEARKRIEQEKKHKKYDNKEIPPYLKYETPLLPTEDCYDSDDSNASKPFSPPHWQKKEALMKILRCMRYVDAQKRYLFCNGIQTVDLQELFPSIEEHKLKRTSSAIWNKSGLSKLPSLAEED